MSTIVDTRLQEVLSVRYVVPSYPVSSPTWFPPVARRRGAMRSSEARGRPRIPLLDLCPGLPSHDVRNRPLLDMRCCFDGDSVIQAGFIFLDSSGQGHRRGRHVPGHSHTGYIVPRPGTLQ